MDLAVSCFVVWKMGSRISTNNHEGVVRGSLGETEGFVGTKWGSAIALSPQTMKHYCFWMFGKLKASPPNKIETNVGLIIWNKKGIVRTSEALDIPDPQPDSSRFHNKFFVLYTHGSCDACMTFLESVEFMEARHPMDAMGTMDSRIRCI